MSANARRQSTYIIKLPLPNTLRSGIHVIDAIFAVVVEIEDDDGVGVGYCYSFGEPEARATQILADELLHRIADEDWHDVVGLYTRLWKSINHVGQAGPPLIALAAIDIALWDLHAKRAGLPLYQMWGGGHATVPAYASGGWLSYSIDELLEEATSFTSLGFKAYKMKVGSIDVASDVARVTRVQEAVGSGVKIMVDANQAYDRWDAVRAGREFQELGVYWLEEPVHSADFEGSAQIAAALDMRVATGETVFGVAALKGLVTSRAADVMMPDVTCSGGLTPMRRVVSLMDVEHLEVAPHLFPEISAHVMASVETGGRLVEFMPRWWKGFLSEGPEIVDGDLVLTDRPGCGIEINPELPRL